MPGQGLSTAMGCRAGWSTTRQDPDRHWAALSHCSPLRTLLASPFLPCSLCPPALPPSHLHGRSPTHGEFVLNTRIQIMESQMGLS